MTVEIERPSIFSPLKCVVAGMSTARGGISRPPLGMNLSFRVGDDPRSVDTNRRMFFDALGIDLRMAAIPHQVHSATVRDVAASGEYEECDALITAETNVALVVTVADCVPVLIVDPNRGIAAAVHAGWRGSADGIVRSTIERLQGRYSVDPANVRAWIGPSAGACCYAVGEDVAERFPAGVAVSRGGQWFVDLKGENARQLMTSGVRQEHIERSPACTICDRRYHSHRRDGVRSGRMMAVLMRCDH